MLGSMDFGSPSGTVWLGKNILQSSGSGDFQLTLPANVSRIDESTFTNARITKYILGEPGNDSVIKVVDGCILSKDGKTLY